jgi:hypothetical protein
MTLEDDLHMRNVISETTNFSSLYCQLWKRNFSHDGLPLSSCEFLHYVGLWVATDVSEECAAPLFRVTESAAVLAC